MKREARVVTLSFLVPLVYGLTMFMEKGVFILPFPLNEVIFFIVTVQFAIWNYKNYQILSILSLLTAFANLMTSQFVWTSIIGYSGLKTMSDNLTLDFIKLAYYSMLLIYGIYYSFSFKTQIRNALIILYAASIITGISMESIIPEIILFFGIFLISFQQKANNPVHYLWLDLAGLETMQLIMTDL